MVYSQVTQFVTRLLLIVSFYTWLYFRESFGPFLSASAFSQAFGFTNKNWKTSRRDAVCILLRYHPLPSYQILTYIALF